MQSAAALLRHSEDLASLSPEVIGALTVGCGESPSSRAECRLDIGPELLPLEEIHCRRHRLLLGDSERRH